MDDLDKAAVRWVMEGERDCTCIDLGCGFPMQSSRFALMGARVVCVDIFDFSETVDSIASALSIDIRFENVSIEKYFSTSAPVIADVIFSQRTIHYIEPHIMHRIAKSMFNSVSSGGHIFVSASGIHSELGNGYKAKTIDWIDRFGFLADGMQEKHGIVNEVCLYSEEDMVSLFEDSGFETKSIYSSSFGNIKGIFYRK